MKIRSEVMKVAEAIEKEMQYQEENHKRWGYEDTKLKRVSVVISSIHPKGCTFPKTDKDGYIKDLKNMVTYPTRHELHTGIKW